MPSAGTTRPPIRRAPKAGTRYARRTIWRLASVAVCHTPAYRAYFDQRTRAGKHQLDTLVAIGRKLLTTIFAILRTGRPDDPAYRHPTAQPSAAAA